MAQQGEVSFGYLSRVITHLTIRSIVFISIFYQPLGLGVELDVYQSTVCDFSVSYPSLALLCDPALVPPDVRLILLPDDTFTFSLAVCWLCMAFHARCASNTEGKTSKRCIRRTRV